MNGKLFFRLLESAFHKLLEKHTSLRAASLAYYMRAQKIQINEIKKLENFRQKHKHWFPFIVPMRAHITSNPKLRSIETNLL